ncbi:LpxL/LpxP family Kdo(2)-lipid IV(A) lauroyl/palmitoleoyl acyltransferase [Photobacterium phosphoreum]|jgi:KDO2-lipid IV(A) lauroyltransferase|uniref:Lipid A biosynthesis acyltransferase n=1 Tax=Photobacterium phosphoreum TaxID=659 RepID=A0AAW4ZL03_PHOPO|nr:LpxL/LpxP family Kdo(2)-lipid IV(A) lauroyl/palmitoleoyl acyltransferase [Photobacterium phosphoreum]KJF86658.1 lipid A biosynthesis lauroyl acyltransferase [Photobacterium phosphoreum]MCD9461447.1 lipid A biosynthesis lauroyl acyltransferase [Photobacterium phosphoreum]MCD9469556.1 lipid A biosynthesis lauroyl acyltransferase [Photobacterium phosphoreum]MCD9473757.1 LpxL/LpxP family Kdo(2)-lipid IV(A) lauroyl/palmitoleoyl acyltransferase [Photobacterium phosphoreum]MCD9480264.1 LpxL/LpxP f
MSSKHIPVFSYSLLHPRYWGTLMLLALMYLLSLLPYRVQFFLGKHIGRLAIKLMKNRRHTIYRNLELCFPLMSVSERESLVKKNIDNSGLALFETGMAWFWSDARVSRHVTIKGMEHMEQLEREGKGALMVAVHSMNLELGARAFGIKKTGMGVYRPNNNPCFDYFQYQGRSRSNRTLIDRKDVKGMLRALKTGERVWYAPDHDYGLRRSTFAPLFAVEQACTTTGTSLLVDASHCAVVPFTMVRDDDKVGHYTLTICQPVEGFPHKDPEAAAVFINKIVEQSIMAAPSQYMWLHRRFKNRPEGQPSLY